MKTNYVNLINDLKKHPFLTPLEILQVIAKVHWHEKKHTCAVRGFPVVRFGLLLGLDVKVCRHTYNHAEAQVNLAYRAGTKSSRLFPRIGISKKYCLEDSTIVEY